IKQVWLTPSRLTVRINPSLVPLQRTNYRFTVRVQFDDDVVADVTGQPGLDWIWEPFSNVDPETGRLIIAEGDIAGAERRITVTLPDGTVSPPTASATMQVEQAWFFDPALPRVQIVPGGGWAGTVDPENVPNILFLGDGFHKDDAAAFEKITNKIVHHLKTDRLSRPFDLLSASMHYWRAFVPASTRGISFRCEVYSFQR